MARLRGVDGTDATVAVAEDLQKGAAGSGTTLAAVAEGHGDEDGTGALLAAAAKGNLDGASRVQLLSTFTTDVQVVAGGVTERLTMYTRAPERSLAEVAAAPEGSPVQVAAIQARGPEAYFATFAVALAGLGNIAEAKNIHIRARFAGGKTRGWHSNANLRG
jgi:hypothetical protein